MVFKTDLRLITHSGFGPAASNLDERDAIFVTHRGPVADDCATINKMNVCVSMHAELNFDQIKYHQPLNLIYGKSDDLNIRTQCVCVYCV